MGLYFRQSASAEIKKMVNSNVCTWTNAIDAIYRILRDYFKQESKKAH